MILTNPLKDLDQLHASKKRKKKHYSMFYQNNVIRKTANMARSTRMCDQCFVGYALAALES